MISAAALLGLFILSVQFMQVARLMTGLPAGASPGEVIALLGELAHLRLLQGLGLLIITAFIFLVIFLLTASYWGHGTCLQGAGIGFFWLLLLSGIGGAWQAMVTDAGKPDGLWREAAVTAEARLLRATLLELSNRHTAGAALADITIVTDAAGTVRDDGLVAWLLRDFPQARFVNLAAAASGEPIALMRDDEALANEIAGDYVGQRFVLRRLWSLAQLDIWDMPAWWSQARLDESQMAEDAVILWLRQDIYDGARPAA